MPTLQTMRFGEIEYDPAAVIRFPAGLPGFEGERGFLALEREETRPAVFLQSCTRADVCFVTLPVNALTPDYELSAMPEDLEAIGLPAGIRRAGPEVLLLAIVATGERGPTVNLLAPVVVNLKTRQATQVIQAGASYGVAEPLPGAEA